MKKKIIICESHLIVTLDIKNILEQHGFDVCGVFRSAEGALRFVESQKPDAVITNVKLNGKMNGIKLAEALNEQHSVKTLLISGILIKKHEDYLNNIKTVLLKKPFSSEELLEKLKHILDN